MNKQEAIKRIEKVIALPFDDTDVDYNRGYDDGLRKAKTIIGQIEPEKPVISQHSAELIDKFKKQGRSLYDAMDVINYCPEPFKDWFKFNSEEFARAWLDGYDVRKLEEVENDRF